MIHIFCDRFHHYAYIKHYTYNEVLYQQGDIPLHLYILLSGQLKIFDKTSQIMDCLVGEFIGAQANFADICYLETVKFFSPGDAFVIRFDYLQERINQYPRILEEIIESLIKKQKIITNISDQQFLQY